MHVIVDTDQFTDNLKVKTKTSCVSRTSYPMESSSMSILRQSLNLDLPEAAVLGPYFSLPPVLAPSSTLISTH